MPRTRRIPARHEVNDETVMPLSVAAEVADAHGVILGVSTKALRREAAHGRLATYELFGRLHTTLGDIKRMCAASAASRKVPAPIGGSAPPRDPDITGGARAAAMASVMGLKVRSQRRGSGG